MGRSADGLAFLGLYGARGESKAHRLRLIVLCWNVMLNLGN